MEVEKLSGMGMSVEGDEMFMRMANFSLCDSRLDEAGPSANCWGVKVRKRILIMASRSVGCSALFSEEAFAKK